MAHAPRLDTVNLDNEEAKTLGESRNRASLNSGHIPHRPRSRDDQPRPQAPSRLSSLHSARRLDPTKALDLEDLRPHTPE